MKEPRPTMISARPSLRLSSVANCWKTRTGSSELSTDTALVSRMRLVRVDGRRQRNGGRRGGVVRPVVFAEAEDIEADLVGQRDLLDQVAQPLGRADPSLGRRIGADIAESVEAEFHARPLPGEVSRSARPSSRQGSAAKCGSPRIFCR